MKDNPDNFSAQCEVVVSGMRIKKTFFNQNFFSNQKKLSFCHTRKEGEYGRKDGRKEGRQGGRKEGRK